MQLKSILYCAVAYTVFSTSPCYAQIIHSITFQNASSGRYEREVSGQQTQDDQSIGVSLNTSENRRKTHSSSSSNGITQEREYTYINSAMSQAIERGHIRRTVNTHHFETYDYSDFATHHSVDLSF